MNSDMLQMLVNLSDAFSGLFLLIQVTFAVIGLYLFGQALLDLYSLNNPTQQRTSRTISMPGICWRFIAAVVLTSIAWFVDVTQNTMMGGDASSGAMMYQSAGLSDAQKAALTAIMGFMALVGYIAFGRGWLMLDKHFNGANTGCWGALMHMLAGTALVYLDVWLPTIGGWIGFDFANILLF